MSLATDQAVAGGGFLNTTNQYGNESTSNQLQKSGRRSRTAPIVIRQALHCGDDGIKIWGTEIQIVSIVARIRNIRIQSIKVIYTIQDMTGRMKVILWLEQDDVRPNIALFYPMFLQNNLSSSDVADVFWSKGCGKKDISAYARHSDLVLRVSTATVAKFKHDSDLITYHRVDCLFAINIYIHSDDDSILMEMIIKNNLLITKNTYVLVQDDYLPKVKVNDYVQIFGNIKTNKGKKVMMAFKIIPITDVNAITFHYLQCINNKLKMEADSKKAATAANTMYTTNLPSSSMINVGNSQMTVGGLNPRQKMVYKLIYEYTLEQGINKKAMYASLKDRMQLAEMEDILDWMCAEGRIYTTIDEEHFRATDAF